MALPGMASSWGEMLRQHKAKQTQCAWKPEDVRVKHVTRYEKSREERQFDPILQYYRDPGREQRVKDDTMRKTILTLNRARDKQLRYTQTYDIITHVPKLDEPRESRPRVPKKAKPDTRQTHNIITNINFDKHHFAKPGERPDVRPPTERKPAGCTIKGRDFNIISNKYITNHDAKDSIDKEVARVRAAERFWQTRDFNPLTCTFYDESKEASHKADAEERAQNHGRNYNEKFPSTIRMSEGVCYDVITMNVKDEKAMAARVAADNKVINSRIANEVEQRVRMRGEQQSKIAEKRGMARVSAKRFGESYRHGYDIVTNERFSGAHAKRVLPNRGSLNQTVWQRMNNESRGAAAAGRPPLARAATASSAVRRSTAEGGAGSGSGSGGSARGFARSPSASAAVDREVIHSSARPQSVPSGNAGAGSGSSVRSGGFAGNAPAVRTGGFAWSPTNNGSARGRSQRSQRSQRPAVPPLTLSRTGTSKPAARPTPSPIVAPASGGVRTGGFA